MSIEILAPGTAEADSAEIVVAAGAPVNVALFRADGLKVDRNCTCKILKVDPNLVLNDTTWSLNRDNPTRILVGAGTYVIRRPGNLTTATGISTG